MSRPLSTGPFGLDPADFGVPGFNEFFYLRTYPEALRAVELGEYASGLSIIWPLAVLVTTLSMHVLKTPSVLVLHRH